MAAPRKYTDQQREAMYSLWTQGIEAAEIARRCSAGLASVAAFDIPRRSVHAICVAIDKERAAPTTLNEAAVAVTEGRFPERVFTLLNEQLTRLEAKQGPLTTSELGRAKQVLEIGTGLERRLRRRKGTERSNGQRNGVIEPPALSPLEELARKWKAGDAESADEPAQTDDESADESEQAQDAFTRTHACPNGDSSPTSPQARTRELLRELTERQEAEHVGNGRVQPEQPPQGR
jgi:hypothetical protein